ncbi:CD1247 N-terminal domain-containing protein [Brevibacillus fulvus]|uniref:Nuclease with TOPRIM domain n=1 Tax=Brevibacillus fulvus TaxID=1125967 RepID=A0A939BQJ3_9BACL|nr:CD1247 N-terminal domain-containing protein [Brevibacillus fulvus]MBM7588572.1 putative nuclease with TOPRIM domain [Brevibacillus fulvus]
MEKLENRISYLQGLADGMDVGSNSKEGKILQEVIQLLDDMYGELRELHARIEETEEYVEAVDEDLEDLELLLYDDAEDDEDLYEMVDDCDDELADDNVDQFYDLDDDETAYTFENQQNDEFDTSYEIECPTCREIIFLHEGTDDEGYHHYVIEPYDADAEVVNPT